MSYFDQFYRRDLGLEKLPDGDWCLPIPNPKPEHIEHWIYRAVDPMGRTADSGYVHSEQEGLDRIDRYHERVREFWEEKVGWRAAGDHAPGNAAGCNVLRVNSTLYVVRSFGVMPKKHYSVERRGFGGHAFHWRWIDDLGQPEAVVQESNNVWYVGLIPERFREMLPDNAVWVK